MPLAYELDLQCPGSPVTPSVAHWCCSLLRARTDFVGFSCNKPKIAEWAPVCVASLAIKPPTWLFGHAQTTRAHIPPVTEPGGYARGTTGRLVAGVWAVHPVRSLPEALFELTILHATIRRQRQALLDTAVDTTEPGWVPSRSYLIACSPARGGGGGTRQHPHLFHLKVFRC